MFIHFILNSYEIGANHTSRFFPETIWAAFGCSGWRFRCTLTPFFLASDRKRSFSLTRLIKSSRHFDGDTCSTRTLIRLAIIRPRTRLFTITPNACGFTLKTRPVLPWYALCGIPLKENSQFKNRSFHITSQKHSVFLRKLMSWKIYY